MSASQLIASFNDHSYVRVDENEVRDRILNLKENLDHFEFCEFPKDEYPYLQGMYQEELINRGWDTDTSDNILVGYVYIQKDIDDKEYRLIACKEMLHSLDSVKDRTYTIEAIKTLSKEIVLPEVLSPLSCHTRRDQFCLILAILVLFPMSTRTKFMDKYKKGDISLKEISDLVLLPELWVTIVMSSNWMFLYDNLIIPHLSEEDEDEAGDEEEKKFWAEMSGKLSPQKSS